MRIESVTYYSQASCCTRSNSLPTVFRLVEGEATAVYTCMNVLTTAVYNHCITLGVITQVTHFSYSIGRVSLMPASQQTRCSWMWLKLWDNCTATVYLHIPSLSGSSRRSVHCQFLYSTWRWQWSVKKFQSCVGRNSSSAIENAYASYNSLLLPPKRWWHKGLFPLPLRVALRGER